MDAALLTAIGVGILLIAADALAYLALRDWRARK